MGPKQVTPPFCACKDGFGQNKRGKGEKGRK